MAKEIILKDLETGTELYPHTLASLVRTADGGNVDEALDSAKYALFIDQWNVAAGIYGRYNEETGFFELNGLKDITYEEALEIYQLTSSVYLVNYYEKRRLRTAFPFYCGTTIDLTNFLLYSVVEIVRFIPYYSDGVIRVTNMRGAFHGAKRVLTPLQVDTFTTTSATQGFYLAFGPNLEYILLKGLNRDLPWGHCPKLELYCFQYVIANAANTKAITITVHPDVYAKLTDETNTEWHKVLLDAAEKQITFITA